MNDSIRTIAREFLSFSRSASVDSTVWLCILNVIPRIGTQNAQECTQGRLFCFITARRQVDAQREAEAIAFEQGWAIQDVDVCRPATRQTVPRALRKHYALAKREGGAIYTSVHMSKDRQGVADAKI